jgi:hypothetical protein
LLKGLDKKYSTDTVDPATGKKSTKLIAPPVKPIDSAAIGMDYGQNTQDYSGINRTDTIFKGLYQGDDPFVVDLTHFDQMFDTKGTRALRVIDVSPVIMAGKNKNNADRGAARSVISEAALDVGIMKIKPEPATPVYIVNRSVPTDAGKLILGLARILLKFLMPIGGNLIADQLDTLSEGRSGTDELLGMLGLSTGGKGKALPRYAQGVKKSSVSSFIAGDSLNGKPNEEQVNID